MSSGLTERDRQRIQMLADGETSAYEIRHRNWPDDPGESDSRRGYHVSESVCERFRERAANGDMPAEIISGTSYSVRTVHYHLKGDCRHHGTARIGVRRCNVIREMAIDGWGYREIAERLTAVTRQQARYHAVGECACNGGVPAVGQRQPRRVARGFS